MEESKKETKRILVHSCCAGCASYVLEYLKENFSPVAFFYNPNIHPQSEYLLRLNEMRALCNKLQVPLIEGPYNSDRWWDLIDPYKHLPERSERCRVCYQMRLQETAILANEIKIDLFTTTLSVSPHKVYRWIEEIGRKLEAETGVKFHPEDFKKKDGFKKSVELSKQYGFTRQDYCGCYLSLSEAFEREKRKKKP